MGGEGRKGKGGEGSGGEGRGGEAVVGPMHVSQFVTSAVVYWLDLR